MAVSRSRLLSLHANLLPHVACEPIFLVPPTLAFLYPRADSRYLILTSIKEAPLPGTEAFEQVCSSHETKWTVLFHFFFHNAPDNLAESLTVGREKLYIKHFWDRLVGPLTPCPSLPRKGRAR